jgi:hypothetical protein
MFAHLFVFEISGGRLNEKFTNPKNHIDEKLMLENWNTPDADETFKSEQLSLFLSRF